MRIQPDEDFHNLINVLANYFREYGTMELERSCLRAVSKIKPVPIEAFSFDKWDDILRQEDD